MPVPGAGHRQGKTGTLAGVGPARTRGRKVVPPEWALLQHLAPEERRRLLAAGRSHHFARREVIFHEGDPGDSLHLVQRGHVAIRVTTPLGDVATFTVVGPGQTFGELALLDESEIRTATV